MASLRTGATLHSPFVSTARMAQHHTPGYALWRIRRINDHGILGFVINNQVGVVVATPHPCDGPSIRRALQELEGELRFEELQKLALTHGDRLDMHGASCDKL